MGLQQEKPAKGAKATAAKKKADAAARKAPPKQKAPVTPRMTKAQREAAAKAAEAAQTPPQTYKEGALFECVHCGCKWVLQGTVEEHQITDEEVEAGKVDLTMVESWSLANEEQKACETCDNSPDFLKNIRPVAGPTEPPDDGKGDAGPSSAPPPATFPPRRGRPAPQRGVEPQATKPQPPPRTDRGPLPPGEVRGRIKSR